MIMELNITQFFNETCPRDYSASAAELGPDAGKITWNHAKEDAQDWQFLDTDEKKDMFRSFVYESGGWDQDEITAWSDVELGALLLQWIAGDIREAELDINSNWLEYYNRAEKGQVNSNLYRAEDGEIYWTGY
jgi:hypothetical protein